MCLKWKVRIMEYKFSDDFKEEDYANINQDDIPQWIKDKIDKRLNNATK